MVLAHLAQGESSVSGCGELLTELLKRYGFGPRLRDMGRMDEEWMADYYPEILNQSAMDVMNSY